MTELLEIAVRSVVIVGGAIVIVLALIGFVYLFGYIVLVHLINRLRP